MTALISLMGVITISLIVVRVGTVALTMTGLSRQIARFQAQSAFSGVGFTTSESEHVVNHPTRRQIIRVLILLGNAGIVSAITSLLLSFSTAENTGEQLFRLGIIAVGLLVLWRIAHSDWVDRHISKLIRKALLRWTQLRVYDYEQLLKVRSGYVIANLLVEEHEWLVNRKLSELQLNHEGVLVLGVERKDGTYIGGPRGATMRYPGDTITCYGREEALRQLSERPAGSKGEKQHQLAMIEQELIMKKEQQENEPDE
ncbi:potassium transporter TrkA [candidate division KSB1 bacterium]|nr:MAG: potassium transporter TrkA [candidate division KSB1 bacterium]